MPKTANPSNAIINIIFSNIEAMSEIMITIKGTA